MKAVLRRFGIENLLVWGDVVHSVQRVSQSGVGASARRLHLDVQDLQLGARHFDLAGVDIARIPSAELQLLGTRIQSGELQLEGLHARRIAFGRFALRE
jgi:hypothetical protein